MFGAFFGVSKQLVGQLVVFDGVFSDGFGACDGEGFHHSVFNADEHFWAGTDNLPVACFVEVHVG